MKKVQANFYEPHNNINSIPAYFRQTEYFKGTFSNISYSFDNTDAEWQIIGTSTKNIEKIKKKNIIYLQQEPPECKLPSFEILKAVRCIITPFKINYPVKQYLLNTPLQWTYDLDIEIIKNKGHEIKLSNNLDLNALRRMDPPIKKKLCSFIISNKFFLPGHKKRLNFKKKIMDHFKNRIDYFGFGINPIKNKKDAIDSYIYSIALENSSYDNYWTEKIADVFLGFSLPIYYGCKNIDKFFDKESFLNIDINNLDESIFKIENALDNPNNVDMNSIIISRNKVLENYNLFKLVSDTINKEL